MNTGRLHLTKILGLVLFACLLLMGFKCSKTPDEMKAEAQKAKPVALYIDTISPRADVASKLKGMGWDVDRKGSTAQIPGILAAEGKYSMIHVHGHGSPSAIGDDDTEQSVYWLWRDTPPTVGEFVFIFLQGCHTADNAENIAKLMTATKAKAVIGTTSTGDGVGIDNSLSVSYTEEFYTYCKGGRPVDESAGIANRVVPASQWYDKSAKLRFFGLGISIEMNPSNKQVPTPPNN